jgi:hypothetical protein
MRWLPLVIAFAGCNESSPQRLGAPDPDGLETSSTETSSTEAAGDDACTVQFNVLQKDAYAETAGRSSDLWPPHTTTELLVTCTRADGSADLLGDFMANHGTEPGETDPNGDVFLEYAGGGSAMATRAEAEALLEAYTDCECGTEFLTLEAIDDALVESVVGALIPYLEANLDCGGDPPVAELVNALLGGDVEALAEALPDCSWVGGGGMAQGLDEALIEALGGSLDGFHVCNNDAVLQAELWDTFALGGSVGSCAPSSDVCVGPKWLYVY